MDIRQKTAVVTGAGSGIGKAVALELARRGVRSLILVDRRDEALRDVAYEIHHFCCDGVPTNCLVKTHAGDVTDDRFRRQVFDEAVAEKDAPLPTICIPAAGITRDALAVRLDKTTGKSILYPIEDFRQVLEVNLIAPTYWALEMVGRIAEDRRVRGKGKWTPSERKEDGRDTGIQGTVIFIGSVSSQGNKGQISYAATKAGLEGVAATLMKEAMFYGVRCAVIHPGFTDTPMVQAMREDVRQKIIEQTALQRLIRPEEIAEAICFLIANPAVSGELWCDAGWHPSV